MSPAFVETDRSDGGTDQGQDQSKPVATLTERTRQTPIDHDVDVVVDGRPRFLMWVSRYILVVVFSSKRRSSEYLFFASTVTTGIEMIRDRVIQVFRCDKEDFKARAMVEDDVVPLPVISSLNSFEIRENPIT